MLWAIPFLCIILGAIDIEHRLAFLAMNLLPGLIAIITIKKKSFIWILYPVCISLIYDGLIINRIPYFFMSTIILCLILLWSKKHLNIEYIFPAFLFLLLGSLFMTFSIYAYSKLNSGKIELFFMFWLVNTFSNFIFLSIMVFYVKR